MLKSLHVRGFKSLIDLRVEFPELTVLFGPNAAGKSNLLEAVQMLSRIATARTLSDAFSGPIRGYPMESFAFPADGLPGLLRQPEIHFSLEANLECCGQCYRYRIGVQIQPNSGSLSVFDEYLARLGKRGKPQGRPTIEPIEGQLHLRLKSKP